MHVAPRSAFAWVVLGVFATLLGWVIARGFAFHQPRPAVGLPWGEARWIGLDDDTEMLYLRRSFVLGAAPRSARLMVSGTDHFEVYINGESVGREDYLGARPSAVYDLTRLLRAGENTLAIVVAKSSKGHQVQSIAALDWNEGGQPRRLVSDGRWRAESRLRVSPGGVLDWNAVDYPDRDWRNATELAQRARDLPQDDALAPEVLDPPPRAGWIWHADPQSGVAAFERTLQLDAPSLRAAWLGVSVEGSYNLAINGFVLEAVAGGATRMDVFDIAPYLRRGSNRIQLQVAGGRAPLRLAAFGRALTPNGTVDFSTPGGWKLAPGGAPVIEFGDFDTVRPALAPAQVLPTQAWQRWQFARWLLTSVAVFAPLLGLGILLTRRASAPARALAWVRYAQPWSAATLLLVSALLADLDPRIDLTRAYGFWLPAAALLAAAVVAVWLALRGELLPESQ